ncbi:hypothetical protein [Paraburkholderia mimosarum]|uniref:hypothetical protein n=1 Tax=Paraburkholderia mimosarum TaxID=312026 RepID=UPI00041B93F6|nr:hypothetical protein [Paraburkholderia mimosarum]
MRAVELGEGDAAALLEQLEALFQNVRGKRFATGFALFGESFKPGGEPAEVLDDIEQQHHAFVRGDVVRTKDGYLAYVGHYDHRNRVVANVVYEAREFNEADLTLVPR